MTKKSYTEWTKVLVVILLFGVMGWITDKSWAAEKYPSRTIQIVICFQPGATDMILRPFTEKLPEFLGQPTTFVYKPGSLGAVGASFVAKARPDGYTLMGTSPSTVINVPLTQEGIDYSLDDFVPICQLAKSPLIVTVKADSPWKTIRDVVEEAKKSPGKLTYSTAGIYSNAHVSMEMLVKSAGVSITHVPTQGVTPAVTALLGGHIQLTSGSMSSLSPHLKSGALRPIGVFEKERLKEFPNLPTFSEMGYPVVISTTYGLLAPKMTSADVVKTLFTACKGVIETHKNFIEDRLEKLSIQFDFAAPEEYARALRTENEVMKMVLKDLMKSSK